MQRLLLAIVVVLAALLLARDPYVEKADAFFLDWLLRNTPASRDHVPLTVVEIGEEPVVETQPNQKRRAILPGRAVAPPRSRRSSSRSFSKPFSNSNRLWLQSSHS